MGHLTGSACSGFYPLLQLTLTVKIAVASLCYRREFVFSVQPSLLRRLEKLDPAFLTVKTEIINILQLR
jgi:hypothetical protein